MATAVPVQGSDGIYRKPSSSQPSTPGSSNSLPSNYESMNPAEKVNYLLKHGGSGSRAYEEVQRANGSYPSKEKLTISQPEQKTEVFTPQTMQQIQNPKSYPQRTISPIKDYTTGKLQGYEDTRAKQSVQLYGSTVERKGDEKIIRTYSVPVTEQSIQNVERARAEEKREYHLARPTNPVLAVAPNVPSAQAYAQRRQDILYTIEKGNLSQKQKTELIKQYNKDEKIRFKEVPAWERHEYFWDFTGKRLVQKMITQRESFQDKSIKAKVYDELIPIVQGVTYFGKGHEKTFREHPIATTIGSATLGSGFALASEGLTYVGGRLIVNKAKNVFLKGALKIGGDFLQKGVPVALAAVYGAGVTAKVISLPTAEKKLGYLGGETTSLTFFGIGAGATTKTISFLKEPKINAAQKTFEQQLKGKVVGTESTPEFKGKMEIQEYTGLMDMLPSTKVRVKSVESADIQKIQAIKPSGESVESSAYMIKLGKDVLMDYSKIPKGTKIKAIGEKTVEAQRFEKKREDYIDVVSEPRAQQQGINKFYKQTTEVGESKLKGKSDYYKQTSSVDESLNLKEFNKVLSEAMPRQELGPKSSSKELIEGFKWDVDKNVAKIIGIERYSGRPVKSPTLVSTKAKVEFRMDTEQKIDARFTPKSKQPAQPKGNLAKSENKMLEKLNKIISTEAGQKKIYIYEGLIVPKSKATLTAVFGYGAIKSMEQNRPMSGNKDIWFEGRGKSIFKEPKQRIFTAKDILKEQIRKEKPYKSYKLASERQLYEMLQETEQVQQTSMAFDKKNPFKGFKTQSGESKLTSSYFTGKDLGGKTKLKGQRVRTIYPEYEFKGDIGENRIRETSEQKKANERLRESIKESGFTFKPDFGTGKDFGFKTNVGLKERLKTDYKRGTKLDRDILSDRYVITDRIQRLDRIPVQKQKQMFDMRYVTTGRDRLFREEIPIEPVKPKLPFWFNDLSGGYSSGGKNKTYTRTSQAYLPDFTATQLGFNVKLPKDKLGKYLNQRFSGIEIRSVVME